MTAALIVSLVLNVALLVAILSIAALFSRTLADTVSLVDRVHIRATGYQEALLDRIMAADWQSFREARAEDLSEEGGQIFPTAEASEDGEFLLAQLSDEELRQMAHERTLLTEDFPDEDRRSPQ